MIDPHGRRAEAIVRPGYSRCTALATAARLFPTRGLLLVTVDGDRPPDDEVPAEPLPAGLPDGADPVRLRIPAGSGAHGRAVAGALTACARSRDAAVIVVGSRGRSAVEEILLGSVAMATLHHAYRPVLVVPSAERRPLP